MLCLVTKRAQCAPHTFLEVQSVAKRPCWIRGEHWAPSTLARLALDHRTTAAWSELEYCFTAALHAGPEDCTSCPTHSRLHKRGFSCDAARDNAADRGKMQATGCCNRQPRPALQVAVPKCGLRMSIRLYGLCLCPGQSALTHLGDTKACTSPQQDYCGPELPGDQGLRLTGAQANLTVIIAGRLANANRGCTWSY